MKKFFTWQDSYNLGIQAIDEQHQKLVEIINSFYDAFYNAETNELMYSILDQLIDYTVYHFNTEEDIFRKYNYNQIAAHTELHEIFKTKVLEFQKQFLEGKTITYRVMAFLREWLTNHILVADKEYAELLKLD
jgi:hemerythrin